VWGASSSSSPGADERGSEERRREFSVEQAQTSLVVTQEVDDDLVFVVVGGYEYSDGMNQPPTPTVRELARRYRVLNLNSEAHGSILRRDRARSMGTRDIARTVFGVTRPRRVEERLWVAPVRGLAAIGPLSVPEAMRRRNVRRFTKVIHDWLAELGVAECILLFYWWALPELVHSVPHLASIYDCADDHPVLPDAVVSPEVVSRLEGRLLDAVDRSYVVSSGLLEHRAGPGRKISVLPNGFDLRFYRQLEQKGFSIPETLRSIRQPIVGYAGGLTGRMDWQLVAELVRRRPEWSFVFVGGDPRVSPENLQRQPNVFFQSSIPYPEALGAISCFDVGTIPVHTQRFSRGNSFLKLLDYFAHGIPTVAPPLPDTSTVAERHPGLLRLAEDADSWENELASALQEPKGSPLREARRAYVEERSVERRVARMLSEALGEHRPDTPDAR
jgi:glycosyltransferase involved in cell wall biosynthesis